MIVPCAQCHTRFKVPDGKVTARGLKVRCSRCGHTFRVFPEGSVEGAADLLPAAARPALPDPFKDFGPPGVSELEKTPPRGTAVSALLARMAPAPEAEDFDVDVAGEEAPSTEPAWNFPPAPTPSPPPAPSRAARIGGAALAVHPTHAPAPEAPPPAHPDWLPAEASPPEVSNTSGPALAAIPARAPLPVRPLPPSSLEASPFDTAPLLPDLPGEQSAGSAVSVAPAPERPLPVPPALVADLAGLSGFTPAWGMTAPDRALSMDGTISSHVSSLEPPPGPEPSPVAPAPLSGGAGIVLDDLPAFEQLDPAPAAGLELDAGQHAEWSGAPPTEHGGMQLELAADLAPLELDRPSRHDPPPARASPAPSALSWDDPFGDPPPPPPEPPATSLELAAPPAPLALATEPPPEPDLLPASALGSSGSPVMLDEAPPGGAGEADHGFFEMPAEREIPRPSPSVELLPEIPDVPEPPADGVSSPGMRVPIGAISRPPARARLGLEERTEPGTARRVSAVVLNVGLAALLLLVVAGLISGWMSSGRLEGSALSPRRLLDAFRSPRGVAPVEITPGTYETRSGRSLLYVRGRVLNRGAPPTRIRVRAELWDGARSVKSGETLAGAIASPEELWRAVTPTELDALRAKLVSTAVVVRDGQQADFLVLLDDAPPDLSGLRLRVTATVEGPGTGGTATVVPVP